MADLDVKVSDGNKIWASILVILILCEFSSACVYYNTLLHAKLFVQLTSRTAVTTEKVWLSVTLVTDLCLALSLVVLVQRRRAGGLARTYSVLKTIIAYTIGTTLLTTLCFILALILVNVLPNSFVSLAFDLLVCKRESNSNSCETSPLTDTQSTSTASLYRKCFFPVGRFILDESISLNARRGLQERITNTTSGDVSIHLSTLAIGESDRFERSDITSSKVSYV